MRLQDVATHRERVWMARTRPVLAADAIAREVRVRSVGGVATMLVADEAVELAADSGEDRASVERAVMDGSRTLHHILDIEGEMATVRSLPFDATTELPSTLAVDEEGVDRLQRLGAPSDPDAAVAWLSHRLLIDRPVPTAVVSVGRGDLDVTAVMTLVGVDMQVDVRLIEGLWRIYAATQKRRRPQRLDLLMGLTITADAYAARLLATSAAEADRLVGMTRYFGAWQEYAEIEYRKAIEDARSLGSAKYSSYRANEDGSYTFDLVPGGALERLEHTLKEGPAELEVSSALPGDIQRQRGRVVLGGLGTLAPRRGETVRVTVRPEESDRQPPTAGYIFGAERGDTIRHERRIQALSLPAETPRRATQIFLDGGVPPAAEPRRPIDARRSKAAAEAFGGPPTTAQLAALDAVLNTPDIALIQGPPGTGKTRVIAAVQAVLAERSNRAGREASLDRVLISAEQHDAVSNAISVRAPSRLPAVKLGTRRGAVDDNDHLLKWAYELRERLEADLTTNSALQVLELAAKADDLIDGARGGKFDRQEIYGAVRFLTAEARSLLGSETVRRLDRHIVEESTLAATAMTKSDAAHVDRITRRLRSDREAYRDDGRQGLGHIRPQLERLSLLTESDARLLDKVVADDEPALADLRRIQAIKDRVLDTCATVLRAPDDGSLPQELDRLLLDAKRDIRERLDDEDLRVPRVVHRLIQRLKNSPGAVRASLERHTAVLGATCQHVLGADMRRVQDTEAAFDSVIIDEAARANPLDLLIPLSMARRRVVLVGDHRQLPQLLDPEVIARVIEARDGEEQRDASAEILERSLFERLFTALDRPGAVTRTVTLDRQYRMHPVIGSLINEFFYEPHGEPISNGVTAADRDPTWTGSRHPLQWIDVPGSAGHSERVPSGSWVRECEARRAADLLIDLLERDPIRTVGVISFYRGQVAAIWRVLVERDMAGETDDGWFEVRSSWMDAFGEAGTPRFLIGTVDSFQGREFDAVILSTVRSGGGFGFLQVENRLCVAMSRARHALIPVGDQQHFRSEDARQRVPALHAVASRAEVRP